MKHNYILLFFLINLSFTQKLIDPPIKPFISVPSFNSLHKLTKQAQKFLSNPEKFQTNEKIFSSTEESLQNFNFGVKCMLVYNFSLYNLQGLSKSSSSNPPYYTAEVGGEKINYNFCYDLNKDGGCNSSNVQVSINSGDKCEKLAGAIGTGNKWEVNNEKIEITLNKLDNSDDIVKYILICDKNKTNPNETTPLENSYIRKSANGKKETVLYFKTYQACVQADFYVLGKFIDEYNWLFAIILIVIGLFECILGKKLQKVTAFIMSVFFIVIIVVVLAVQFILPAGSPSWSIWLILVISLALGLVLGYFIAKHNEKFLPLLVGGVSGFFLGQFLYSVFGNKIELKPLLVNILFVSISIIVLVIIAYFLQSFIIIFATSFIGSYVCIRGVSFILGGFPSEFTIIDLINAGEKSQITEYLNWQMYVYLVVIVVMTGFGIYIQRKINRNRDERKDIDELDGKLVK